MKPLFLIATSLSLLTQFSWADVKYPKNVPLRTFGNDQDVGSCMAESYATAVEHKLAEQGIFLKVSVQHLHAWAWKDQKADLIKTGARLEYTGTSAQLVKQYGGIIPDYLLPEDLEGVAREQMSTIDGISIRPSIESMGVYDGQVPTQAFRFSVSQFSFEPGYRNSSNFDGLMNAVRSGRMVTLSYDSSFAYAFSGGTGLLLRPYVADPVYFEKASHSSAIVGYDDEQQGFIVRNTWNDADTVRSSTIAMKNPLLADDLAKFRKKISLRPLPGYFLFPYQFVRDAAARKIGGFSIIDMDLGAFANTYVEKAAGYEALNTFYSCSRRSLGYTLKLLGKKFAKFEDPQATPEEKNAALTEIKSVIYGQIGQSRMLLNYGKQARRKDGSIDHVKDFFEGKYITYYCGSGSLNPAASFWPMKGKDSVLETPEFMEHIRALSLNYSNLIGWYDFLKFLSKQEYIDELSR